MLALVAPYGWPIARFFADALTAAGAAEPRLRDGRRLRKAPPRDPIEWDPEGMAGLLLPEGPLAAAFPEYEHRESQLQMLLAVAQILERGGRLVVEAGTGTGKSIAYLIPALGRALAQGEKVIVSTATHTLQEQLLTKDLPFLKQWLPWDFEAVLLKGRSNYLSLRRWRRYLAEPCHDSEELRFKLKGAVLAQRDRQRRPLRAAPAGPVRRSSGRASPRTRWTASASSARPRTATSTAPGPRLNGPTW